MSLSEPNEEKTPERTPGEPGSTPEEPAHQVSLERRIIRRMNVEGTSSRAAAKKIKKKLGEEERGREYMCLHEYCCQHFSSKAAFKRHLRDRKHTLKSEKLKKAREEFRQERLPECENMEEVQRCADEGSMSRSQLHTWRTLNSRLALLEIISHA